MLKRLRARVGQVDLPRIGACLIDADIIDIPLVGHLAKGTPADGVVGHPEANIILRTRARFALGGIARLQTQIARHGAGGIAENAVRICTLRLLVAIQQRNLQHGRFLLRGKSRRFGETGFRMRVLRLAAGHDPRAIAARVVFVCLGAGQRFLRAVLHLRVAGIGVGMLRKATLRLHGVGRKGQRGNGAKQQYHRQTEQHRKPAPGSPVSFMYFLAFQIISASPPCAESDRILQPQ